MACLERSIRGDILPRLKSWASRGSDVAPVDSDGWESTVSDRRQWQCHATDARSRKRVASYLVVLCRSAWSAYCFGFGSRRGKHRVNCQFPTHEPFYDVVWKSFVGFIPRLKSWVFSSYVYNIDQSSRDEMLDRTPVGSVAAIPRSAYQRGGPPSDW
jgi:hypothetical protein